MAGYINKVVWLIMAFISCAIPVSAQRDRQLEDTRIFTVTSLSEENIYVGVPVCFSVRLYSTNPDIDFVKPLTHPQMKGFEMKRYPMVRTNRYNHVTREKYDGKLYYAVWLEDIVLIPRESGSFTLRGEDFIVGINEYEVFSDPFWGTVQRAVPVEYPVDGQNVKVKVKTLPSNAPKGFSGAVGEYKIRTTVPRAAGKGDTGTVVVQVTGQGDLSDVDLPDLLSLFPSSLGVKSVSQDVDSFLEEGAIKSVLSFECTFSPLSDENIIIPEIPFVYFNPRTKKYETAKSSPVEIKVEESIPSGAPPVYQQI